ncbi:MAG: hypothetical protein EP343_27715 [Deltaproteobacteria bacterium]|nr:MAG: hypothetical protein EP343_27715 [Deltaproteobacteria bacterium]
MSILKTVYKQFFNGVHRHESWQPDSPDWKSFFREQDPTYTYRKLLGPRAMQVIRAVADALFDEGEGGAPADRLDWFEREINDYFASSDGASKLILKLAPWVLEISPFLTLTSPTLLTQLDLPLRRKSLERLEHSPIPQLALIYLLCKALICLTYFENEEALAELGFDGGCMTGTRPDLRYAYGFSA